MKKSIKWKITIIFVIVMICCIGSIYIFNAFFLEDYYLNNRKEVLKKTYTVLDLSVISAFQNGLTLKDLFTTNNKGLKQNEIGENNLYNNENFYDSIESNFARFLRELQNTYNISIALVDSDNNIYSLYQNNMRFDRRIISYIFQNEENDKQLEILEKNDKYQISICKQIFPIKQIKIRSNVINNQGLNKNTKSNNSKTYDNSEQTKSNKNQNSRVGFSSDLECFGFLSDNETIFLMTTPLVSLREPLEFFNKMIITLSILIILIGSIIIYITSYKLTIPIKKLAILSSKMANLDFKNKYTDVNRIDEIGVLGKSMNDMSNKLETAIKDLKNANIKLLADLKQKEKLDNMRQEFIANVSHELKTPIALIQGYAEGLQSGMAENKEDKDFYLNVIIDESDKMNKMVRQLLNLSSLEIEIDDIEICKVNLYQIVSQVVKSQDLTIKQNELIININIPMDTYVWVDEFKFEEVVRNYLTNAINHVDSNKLIKIWIDNINDNKIRFYVYNSGEQLSNENLSNVWEKFYKTDKARTRSYGGTGLGLSIVKAIADKHNTQCGCENVDESSDFPKGIRFYFDLAIK